MWNSSAIGVDLGSVNICMSIYRAGRLEIIESEHGNVSSANCVAFTDRERLIGDAAKNQYKSNPSNTLFGVHRLLGLNYRDAKAEVDKNMPSTKIIEADGKPKLSIVYKGENKLFSPEEVVAMVLSKLKREANKLIGTAVTHAVITVPNDFTSSQRWSLTDAAEIAGLKILRITNSSIAAALTFEHENNFEKDINVFVLDVGASSTNASVISMRKGTIVCKASVGSKFLGGNSFTKALVEFFSDAFPGHLASDEGALQRLRDASENAKIELTSAESSTIHLDAFCGVDFESTITRSKFELINQTNYNAIEALMEEVLNTAKLAKAEVQEVVVVGGTIRMPCLQKLVKKFFDGKDLNLSLNLEEGIAKGVGYQAARLNHMEPPFGFADFPCFDDMLQDVSTHDLGFETVGGFLEKLIPKNSSLPNKKSNNIDEFPDSSLGIIRVFEGHHEKTMDNDFIGEVTGIPFWPGAFHTQIIISFEIDESNKFFVSAMDTRSGQINKIQIRNFAKRFNSDEIAQYAVAEKGYIAEDILNESRIAAKNSLETLGFTLNNICDKVKAKCSDTIQWAEANKMASLDDFKKMHENLKRSWEELDRGVRAEFLTAWPNTATVVQVEETLMDQDNDTSEGSSKAQQPKKRKLSEIVDDSSAVKSSIPKEGDVVTVVAPTDLPPNPQTSPMQSDPRKKPKIAGNPEGRKVSWLPKNMTKLW